MRKTPNNSNKNNNNSKLFCFNSLTFGDDDVDVDGVAALAHGSVERDDCGPLGCPLMLNGRELVPHFRVGREAFHRGRDVRRDDVGARLVPDL